MPHVGACVCQRLHVFARMFVCMSVCVCIDWTVSDHHPLKRRTHHVKTNTTVPSEVKDGLILSPGLYVERRTRITAPLRVCMCVFVHLFATCPQVTSSSRENMLTNPYCNRSIAASQTLQPSCKTPDVCYTLTHFDNWTLL